MTVTLIEFDALGGLAAVPRAVAPGRLSAVLRRGGVDARVRPVIVSLLPARVAQGLDGLDPQAAGAVLDRHGVMTADRPKRHARAGAVVVVRAVVAGAGRGGGGTQAKQIGSALAMIAVLAAAPWAAGLISGAAFGGAAVATQALTGLIVAGGAVAISRLLLPQSRRNADAARPTYGVSGGGNLPRPQDHIPVLYGRCWHAPDLSQPDYVEWEGDAQVLYKRMTIGLGQYELLKVRAGNTILWEGGAVTAAFPGAAVELIQPGAVSALVPLTVVTAPDVSGQPVPGTLGSPTYVGPYVVNAAGTTVTQLVVDLSFPGGGLRVDNKGRTFAVTAAIVGEYRRIDDQNAPLGTWTTLFSKTYQHSSAATARYSERASVPAGRYEVRVARTNASFATQGDTPQWDQLRGIRPDSAVRSKVTEIAIRVKGTAGQSVTSFSDVMVQVQRLLPVWSSGAGWSAPQATRSAQWAAADVIRNAGYGGAQTDAKIDLPRFAHYAALAATRGDTYDGVIRGPDSVLEAAEKILRVARSQPIWAGRMWTIVRDEASAVPRHVYTARNMVRGSVSVQHTVATGEGAGDIILEYNEDADPKKPREVRVSARAGGAFTARPRRVRIEGIAGYAHAWRECTFLAHAELKRASTVVMDAGLDHRLVTRADLAIVDIPFLEATAVRGVQASGGTGGRTLTLDADVTIAAGNEAVLRRRDGRHWGPVRVTQGAAAREIVLDAADVTAVATATGIALAAALRPIDGGSATTVRIGAPSAITAPWRIVSVKPKSAALGTIVAVSDPPEIHTADGSTPPSEFVPPSRDGIPATIDLQGLVASPVTNGAVVEMTWSVRPSLGAVRYLVQIAYTDSGVRETIYDGTETSGRTTIRPTNLTVYARAFGVSGQASPERSYAVVPPVPTVVADEVVPGAVGASAIDAEVRAAIEASDQRWREALSRTRLLFAAQLARLVEDIRSGTDGTTITARVRDMLAADAANGTAISDVQGEVVAARDGQPSLAVRFSSVLSAIASGDTAATAAAVQQLNAAFGGNTAEALARFAATAGPGGAGTLIQLFAKAAAGSMEVLAGLEIFVTTGGTRRIRMQAGLIDLLDAAVSGGNPVPLVSVVGGKFLLGSEYVVGHPNIQAGAVTQTADASGSVSYTTAVATAAALPQHVDSVTPSWVTVASCTITTTNKNGNTDLQVFVDVDANITSGASSTEQVVFRVIRQGTNDLVVPISPVVGTPAPSTNNSGWRFKTGRLVRTETSHTLLLQVGWRRVGLGPPAALGMSGTLILRNNGA